jgi:hypothetical protein
MSYHSLCTAFVIIDMAGTRVVDIKARFLRALSSPFYNTVNSSRNKRSESLPQDLLEYFIMISLSLSSHSTPNENTYRDDQRDNLAKKPNGNDEPEPIEVEASLNDVSRAMIVRTLVSMERQLKQIENGVVDIKRDQKAMQAPVIGLVRWRSSSRSECVCTGCGKT